MLSAHAGLPSALCFLGIGTVVTMAVWFLAPLVWKQLIYARDSIPAGIHWIKRNVTALGVAYL